MTTIAKIPESLPITHRGKRMASLSDSQLAGAWLNEANGTAAYRRILGLYGHLNRLDDLLSGRIQPTAQNEWFVQQHAANDLLARYSFTPCIARDPQGERRYYATARHVQGPTAVVSDGHITISVSEPMVAATLARLYAAHELFHLHRCERSGCGRWHARVRTMDRFCSRECQIKHYTGSDEARERNRKAQRKHRTSEGYLNITSPKKGEK